MQPIEILIQEISLHWKKKISFKRNDFLKIQIPKIKTFTSLKKAVCARCVKESKRNKDKIKLLLMKLIW